MFESVKHRIDELLFGGDKIVIPKNALVLDVASGGNPYWRSNVLMDKFVNDNSERDAGLIIDRDFVVGDAIRLPFKDKAFDFVVARHIIEHLPDPEIFIKELERVARAGYIETPSSFSENLYGWPFHIWQIDVEGDCLVIKSKKNGNNIQLKKMSKHFDVDKNLKKFAWRNRRLFYTGYYWINRINYTMSREEVADKLIESHNDSMGDFNLKEYKRGYKFKVKLKSLINTIRRNLSYRGKRYNLLELISCIGCNGAIITKDDIELSCEKCGAKYDFKDGIPIML